MRIFGAIEKFDSLDDGTLLVSGTASSEIVDSDGETISADAMKSALPEYMRFANLREMHKPIAAGKTVFAEVLEDGKTFIKAHVVDSESVKKIKAGVLKGFSIGANQIKRAADNAKRIISLALTEISLVDRPSNPEAVFDVWKCDKNQTFMLTLDQKILAKTLGLAETATETEVSDALIKRLAPPGSPAPVPATTSPPPLSESILKAAIDGALAPVLAKVTAIESRASAAEAAQQQAERSAIVAQAGREGKVIPLSQDEINQMPTALLKSMVSNLVKTVNLLGPRAIKPINASDKETLRKGMEGAYQRSCDQMTEFFKQQAPFQGGMN